LDDITLKSAFETLQAESRGLIAAFQMSRFCFSWRQAEDIQKLGFGLVQNEESELHTALLTLRDTHWALKNASSHATHQEWIS
jgi:hypothetical protein